ncbi:hypothetical protein C9374_007414 [Naegleria lovaniensis]|uniref:Uncharacterized protein n=1 Tax=Naegleria lovaniensis TaxID=51637 RepID=A0AA88GLW8_NAELO|nr:uncharacterized protein C9374_007414 [Naegleria lovaniensis]KAG2379275.1 hypothetical protein C9374_007414 [Naegleria lovaniensis]
MTAPSFDEVLDKLKSFLEIPEDQQPKECPFNAEEKKVFIQNHSSMVQQCPAFHDHGCPFSKIHSVRAFKEKLSHIPQLEQRCPAMAGQTHTHDVVAQIMKD